MREPSSQGHRVNMVLIYKTSLAMYTLAETISFTLMFSVAVFGAVRPGPADEVSAVSVLHRAAV